jgi:hypothetical protein
LFSFIGIIFCNGPGRIVVPCTYCFIIGIEFLENLSVTPGRVYVKNASLGIEEIDPTDSKPLDKMPDNLSDVEKANWLQLKYSILMDVPVESITNIALLKKIDEWMLNQGH